MMGGGGQTAQKGTWYSNIRPASETYTAADSGQYGSIAQPAGPTARPAWATMNAWLNAKQPFWTLG